MSFRVIESPFSLFDPRVPRHPRPPLLLVIRATRVIRVPYLVIRATRVIRVPYLLIRAIRAIRVPPRYPRAR
jgi:hypothetical protein